MGQGLSARPAEEGASGQPSEELLPEHDTETINSHKVQYKLGKLGKLGQQVNRVRCLRCAASLGQRPESARPPSENDVLRGGETRDLAETRQRSLSRPGAIACSTTRPVGSSRVIPSSEFVSMERRFMGMEEPLAARCRV